MTKMSNGSKVKKKTRKVRRRKKLIHLLIKFQWLTVP
jgi:hypothetical protein